jgi:hypothetical protein
VKNVHNGEYSKQELQLLFVVNPASLVHALLSSITMHNGSTRMCTACGLELELSGRYAMRNHMRSCSAIEGGIESEEEIVNALDRDAVVLDEDDIVGGGQPIVEERDDEGVNFEFLTQFLHTGRVVCNESELQLVKFMHMAQKGYGVSRAFSVGMLEYSKQSGGANMLLPNSWIRCVEDTTKLIERLEGRRKTFTLDVAIPENVRELLADPSQTHIGFEFECPITEMMKVAMFSKTCKDWDNVALSYEDNDGHLDDFCNGDRYKRISQAISPGGAILGCVLATDGICLDKCMFDSQEVSP